MADLKAQLTLSADASGVEAGVNKAKRSLADLGATAENAGKQASAGLADAGKGGAQASQRIESATKSIIGSIQRTTATLEAGGKTSTKYFEALASQRGVPLDALKPYLAQLDAVQIKQQSVADGFSKLGLQGRANLERLAVGDKLTQGLSLAGKEAKTAADQVNQASKTTTNALRGVQLSARETTNALRQVPAQFTDIATSLAAGQSPLNVLLQQGGQLKDSFGGIGPAAQALGGYIAGLVTPFTLAAAAVGAYAIAAFKGAEQSKALNDAIVLTGNYAGQTEGKVNALVRTLSGSGQIAAGSAREFAQAIIATGQVGPEVFDQAVEAAARFAAATGKTADEVSKDFARIAESPTKFAIEYNKSLNFLSAAQIKQIKDFEDVGRAADAQGIIYNALNQRLRELEPNLGTLDRALRDLTGRWSAMWESATGAGRVETVDQRLQQIEDRLRRAANNRDFTFEQRQSQGVLPALTDAQRQDLQGEAERLRGQQKLEQATAKAEAETRKLDKEGTDARSFVDGYLKRTKSVEQLNKALSELERSFDKAAQAGVPFTKAQQDAAIARLKEDFKPPRQAKNTEAEQIRKAQLGLDIETIKAAQDQLAGIYANSERVLEATRSAGILSDKEYYQAKLSFINLEAEAKEDALRKEIARLSQEKLSGKEKIDNDRKIAEAESRLAIAQADAASKREVLSVQQEASAKRLASAYLSARQAAQDYFDTIQRQQDRELEGTGRGREFRQRNEGIAQVEERFASQRRDLENLKAQLQLEGRFTDEAEKQYEQRLQIINEFQQKSIDSFNKYFDTLIEKQKSFSLGASEAFANYLTEARNVASQTEQIFSNAFRGLEDSITDFIMTGKGSFRELGESIARDIIRSSVRQSLGQLFEFGSKELGGQGGILGQIGQVIGGKPPVQDAGLASFKSLGVDPATASLRLLQQSAEGAARAITTPTTGDFARADRATGEQSIMDLFRDEEGAAAGLSEELVDTRTSAQAFGDVLGPASIALLSLGKAGSAASAALSILPTILSVLGSTGAAKGVGDFISGIGSFFGGFFANGGDPPMNKVSVVGERGPELFIPRSPGTIVPLDKVAPQEQRPIQVSIIQQFAPNTNRQTIDQAAVQAAAAVRRATARGTV